MKNNTAVRVFLCKKIVAFYKKYFVQERKDSYRVRKK